MFRNYKTLLLAKLENVDRTLAFARDEPFEMHQILAFFPISFHEKFERYSFKIFIHFLSRSLLDYLNFRISL